MDCVYALLIALKVLSSPSFRVVLHVLSLNSMVLCVLGTTHYNHTLSENKGICLDGNRQTMMKTCCIWAVCKESVFIINQVTEVEVMGYDG